MKTQKTELSFYHVTIEGVPRPYVTVCYDRAKNMVKSAWAAGRKASLKKERLK